MELKSLSDIDLRGKRVIFRTDYNVPLVTKNGRSEVGDDTRIEASLKSLRFLIRKKCKIIILSWLGRPGGKRDESLSMDPVARRLEELLKKPVKKLDESIGVHVVEEIAALKPGGILMLENIRFLPEEEHHDDSLAETLATYADCIVFEAFGQSHRDYPSTTGILSRLPSVCGYTMQSEVTTLHSVLASPAYPFVVLLGGAKISDKIDLITNLLPKADALLIGGALSHNFLKARGVKISASLIEGRSLDLKKHQKRLFTVAEDIMQSTRDTYVNLGPGLNIPKLVLPIDLVASPKEGPASKTRDVDLDSGRALPWNWMYMDIGPKTVELFSAVIKKAKMVFWNGPLGYIESPQFEVGTLAIAKCIAESPCKSIVGGGDTEGFLKRHKLYKSFDYVSTGGGAVLEFLSGKEFPVLKYLKK